MDRIAATAAVVRVRVKVVGGGLEGGMVSLGFVKVMGELLGGLVNGGGFGGVVEVVEEEGERRAERENMVAMRWCWAWWMWFFLSFFLCLCLSPTLRGDFPYPRTRRQSSEVKASV